MPQDIQQPFHGIDPHRFDLAIDCKAELALAAALGGVGHYFPPDFPPAASNSPEDSL